MSSSELTSQALLRRAVDLDQQQRLTEALLAYKEGLQALLHFIKETADPAKKKALEQRAKQYMDRAETLDAQIERQKRQGSFHEQLHIGDDDIGHSYDNVFGRYLDHRVTNVHISDPYVRAHWQVVNFLRFCELLVKKCPELRLVQLNTGQHVDVEQQREQKVKLDEIKSSLSARNVELRVTFSKTLHDRDIRLNTGWVIKIGRGLDIFKPPKSKLGLGAFDLDLRPCYETNVDIYFTPT